MFFYSFEGSVSESDEQWAKGNDNRRLERKRTLRIKRNSAAFNRSLHEKTFFFVSEACMETVEIGMISAEKHLPDSLLSSYLGRIEIALYDLTKNEITFEQFCQMLRRAERHDFIESSSDVLEQFDIGSLWHHGFGVEEEILQEADTADIYKRAGTELSVENLKEELDRIYSGSGSAGNPIVFGHPVHYIIQTDDREIREKTVRLLLQALYANGRIHCRRFSFFDYEDRNISTDIYNAWYKTCSGGAAVINYTGGDTDEDSYAAGEWDMFELFCKTMRKYCNAVLTIFCLPLKCPHTKSYIYENAGNTAFIELKEQNLSGTEAKDFLKTLAGKTNIPADETLYAKISPDKHYLAPDLHKLFDEWYSSQLRSSIYPQYSHAVKSSTRVFQAKPKGSAYDELMEMIGLKAAKKVLLQALDFYKAQKLFAERGISQKRPGMHMVFSGNPGTAKTSAARLFAGIMQENRLLPKGTLIEAGRGDLVGKYVGWTAPLIQKKFRQARGGILFIDEAYSLVDDRDGSYGDEAISTIVQEMENYREDVIVIFAGYPEKMETFLAKNPGLRSRITFHVPFDDYSTEELCSIADLFASKNNLTIAEEAKEKLARLFADAEKEADFGNGRYVRNVIERAQMAHAQRLMHMDLDSVSNEDIRTLRPEDIELPRRMEKAGNRIGFL